MCRQYHERINRLEEQKYDYEYEVSRKDMEARIFKNYLIFLYTHRQQQRFFLIISENHSIILYSNFSHFFIIFFNIFVQPHRCNLIIIYAIFVYMLLGCTYFFFFFENNVLYFLGER